MLIEIADDFSEYSNDDNNYCISMKINEASLKKYLEAAVQYRIECIVERLQKITEDIRLKDDWTLQEVDAEINRVEHVKRMLG
jgi:hypothetical protein